MSLAIPYEKIDFNLIRFVCTNNTSSHHNDKYNQPQTFKRNTRNHVPNRTMRNSNTCPRPPQTNNFSLSLSHKKHYQYQFASHSLTPPNIMIEDTRENLSPHVSTAQSTISVSNELWVDDNLYPSDPSAIIQILTEQDEQEPNATKVSSAYMSHNDSCYQHLTNNNNTSTHGNVMYFKILYNTSFTSMTGISILFLYNDFILSDIQNLICKIENYIISKYIKFYKNTRKVNKNGVNKPTHKTIVHQVYAFLSNASQHQKDHFILKINGLHHNIGTNVISFTFSIQ